MTLDGEIPPSAYFFPPRKIGKLSTVRAIKVEGGQKKKKSLLSRWMQVTGVNGRMSLCDAGLPAAVEIKQLMVSHARMQSRPSDGAEQKVEGRHASGRGSRGAFVSRQ